MITSNFPRKILTAPYVDDISGDLYKDMTLANAKRPISEMVCHESYMPDYYNAVAMGDNDHIYRINVPGFFYKLTKDSTQPDTGSGLVISRFNHIMNSNAQIVHALIVDAAPKASGTNKHRVDHTFREDDRTPYYLSTNFTPVQPIVKTTDTDNINKVFCLGCIVEYFSTKTGWTRPVNYDAFQPTTIKNSSGTESYTCIAAVRPNNRENPAGVPGEMRLLYFVCSGSMTNSATSLANSLVPIIPGAKTGEAPLTGKYPLGVTGTAQWDIPNCTAEMTNAYTSRVAKFVNVDNMTGWGDNKNKEYCILIPKGVNLYAMPAVIESMGTYVACCATTKSNSHYEYFIPALAARAIVNCNRITNIRKITPTSINYNIADIPNIRPSNAATSVFVHKEANNISLSLGICYRDIVQGKFNGTDIYKSHEYFCTVCPGYQNSLGVAFTDIFEKSSISGLSNKFIAQKLNLVPWDERPSGIGDGSYTGDLVDIVSKTAPHQVYDPVVDGP